MSISHGIHEWLKSGPNRSEHVAEMYDVYCN
jgi:hypothetical protein